MVYTLLNVLIACDRNAIRHGDSVFCKGIQHTVSHVIVSAEHCLGKGSVFFDVGFSKLCTGIHPEITEMHFIRIVGESMTLQGRPVSGNPLVRRFNKVKAGQHFHIRKSVFFDQMICNPFKIQCVTGIEKLKMLQNKARLRCAQSDQWYMRHVRQMFHNQFLLGCVQDCF